MVSTTILNGKVKIYLSGVSEQPYIIDSESDPVGENKRDWIMSQIDKLTSSTRPLAQEEEMIILSCLKTYVGYKEEK